MSPSGWLLCGGIGSGKSAVRGFLEEHGVRTIDADSVGHEILAQGGAAFDDVVSTWPTVLVDGHVDREALGRIVFADPEELRKLEERTHPHIFSQIKMRLRSLDGPVVVEIPSLKQPFTGDWRRVVVDAPDEVRLERAVARGVARDQVLRRMENQPSRQQWLGAADLVIPNRGDLADLEAAAEAAVDVIRGVAST